MTAGLCWRGWRQRQAGQRAHLQIELRLVAGVERVVAAVVRARRDLVDQQHLGAVLRPRRRTRHTTRRRIPVPRAIARAACARPARPAPAPGCRRTPRSSPGCRRGAGCAAPGKSTMAPSQPRATQHRTLGHAAPAGARARRAPTSAAPRPPPVRPGRAPGPGPCRRSPGARSSECRAAGRRPTAASSCASVITAYGAVGTPQALKCAFSRIRSCAIASDWADGATGRCAPSVNIAPEGTFSNSVVMAAQRCIICASACSSR